ncbi:hypothetical protein XELAEV_18003927mg [Xenopus laevis]|uniref:Uncharacterized protein n=1 Tax=Xenopus laevis TaxID=8355 RepID=A0A974BNA5_XENLA|nr:hypothetical protein XELAEV_18003927mg [Xenopus laevis]
MSPPLSGLFVDSDFAAKVSSLVHGGDTQLALLSDNISWQRPLVSSYKESVLPLAILATVYTSYTYGFFP